MSIYDIPLKTLDGDELNLVEQKGKALLLVNVASKCGLTPQYAGLEKLHEEYAARGFSVIGIPCNQFGGQEPGSPEEIQTFCSTTYGVTFPLTEKIEVNGADRHPLYEALTKVADTEGKDGDIRWNFEKFVISPDGEIVARFSPVVKPEDETLIRTIESVLPV
jgi:glutathione peroxidase